LLHLAFRRDGERAKDFLFADAPGEWFQKWGINRNSPDAEGARWVAEHADAFLLVADREALAGEAMGSARGALQVLAQRVAAERAGRPIALVWTKVDVEISAGMESTVRDAVFGTMPDASEFSVSVVSKKLGEGNLEDSFSELLTWSLATQRSGLPTPSMEIGGGADPLFVLGLK
jgi:hypothetical protein